MKALANPKNFLSLLLDSKSKINCPRYAVNVLGYFFAAMRTNYKEIPKEQMATRERDQDGIGCMTVKPVERGMLSKYVTIIKTYATCAALFFFSTASLECQRDKLIYSLCSPLNMGSC